MNTMFLEISLLIFHNASPSCPARLLFTTYTLCCGQLPTAQGGSAHLQLGNSQDHESHSPPHPPPPHVASWGWKVGREGGRLEAVLEVLFEFLFYCLKRYK